MGLPFVYTIWELRGTMKEIGLDNEEFEEDSSKKRMDELKRNFDISANAPDTIKEAWRLASQIQEAKKQNLDNFSDTFQKTEVEQDKVEEKIMERQVQPKTEEATEEKQVQPKTEEATEEKQAQPKVEELTEGKQNQQNTEETAEIRQVQHKTEEQTEKSQIQEEKNESALTDTTLENSMPEETIQEKSNYKKENDQKAASLLKNNKKKQLSTKKKIKLAVNIAFSFVWNVIRYLFTGFYRTLKFLLNLITVLLIVILISGCILFTRYHSLYTNIRQTEYDRIANLSQETFTNLNSTRVYNDKGKLLAELTAADYEYVEINKVSRYIQEGYIAVEDKNFKEHIGFDLTAIARAGVALIKNSGEITQGGSTITQQVVKNTLLTSEQTYVRKCAEILLAMDMEKKFTKAQIMEFYVNSNFYGNQCYGVEAACQYYFGKAAKDISIAEAAMIVGMSNSPSKYNPVSDYDAAIKKRNHVLEKMYENGVITEEEKNIAKEDKMLIVEKRTEAMQENYQVSYAIYSAVITLMEKDGFEFQYTFEDKEDYDTYKEKYAEAYSEKSEKVRAGGYDIYTSLNNKQQKQLQRSVDSVLSGFSEKQEDGRYAVQGAAVCVDNETGYVTAIVGGRGKKDLYNRAYLARRQPGSTIKPLLDYAPAFEMGDYFPSKIMNDHAIANGPKNSGGSYRGNISMREAIARSINTIAYQTLQGIGVQNGMAYLANMRFNSLSYVDNNNLSISIGGFTNGVRVVEMAKGYATLANSGNYIERNCIQKIEQQGEGIIYTDTKTSHQVFSEDTAWLMTDCLKGTMELSYGTGHACALEEQISAGKTGTTNESKDGWFCGYTTRYTTAVWVGRDDNKSIYGMYGATYAGKIWKSYMDEIHFGLEKEDFVKPDTVQKKFVGSDGVPTDADTGRKDYFSVYAENKRSLLEQERAEIKAVKRAEKVISNFENFYIEKVEDCYQVEEKYKNALKTLMDVSDADKRIDFSTRIADKYSTLKAELENWSEYMAAYEIELARKEREEQEKAAKAAAQAKELREKQLAITKFQNALTEVKNTTDVVTEYTYSMLKLASEALTECAKYSEYDTLLKEYNNEKSRIAALKAQNETDAQTAENYAVQQETERANRIAQDQERVAQENAAESGTTDGYAQ